MIAYRYCIPVAESVNVREPLLSPDRMIRSPYQFSPVRELYSVRRYSGMRQPCSRYWPIPQTGCHFIANYHGGSGNGVR